MTQNMELERSDLVIDRDMEVDCDTGEQITVYIECWFDADRKFHINTASDDSTWLNIYGRYNPYRDTLMIECVIGSEDAEDSFDYEPTAAETHLIKSMIAEKILELHNQTPMEFCESFYAQGMNMGGM